MPLSPLKALILLQECTGEDIWSLKHCTQQGVPETWIQELADCFESGFDVDTQTIYVQEQVVNQYQGIRDVDLARKLASQLNLNLDRFEQQAISRSHLVQLLQDAAEEE